MSVLTVTPPPILYDIDGVPMAVHGHMPPRQAFRIIWREHRDIVTDLRGDLCSWPAGDDDVEDGGIRLSVYREIVEEITPTWHYRSRYNPLDKEMVGEFDDDSWWPVPARWAEIGAQPYMQLGFF